MTTAIETTVQTSPWIPDDGKFGTRLAMVRQHMGWGNVVKAAEECGLPANSWRNWERDNRIPHNVVPVAAAIELRTGVDSDWLIRGQRIPGRRGRQSTDEFLAVAGQPRRARPGKVTTQPSGPLAGVMPSPGFPRTARIPRKRVHEAA